jgi:hypothetical protein
VAVHRQLKRVKLALQAMQIQEAAVVLELT